LLDNIGPATWVAEGKGTRVVYTFFDPDCPYCHKLYDALHPLGPKQYLKLRWIPVGMLADTSLDKAAAIL
jgi:thiol:disulfide interchange protein DsbG